jgi:hypothetical protein
VPLRALPLRRTFPRLMKYGMNPYARAVAYRRRA